MLGYFIIVDILVNPYRYFKDFDIYAHQSRFEWKSVTVREARMLCKPVVVTNYPTAKSQINHKVDGVIVPMDNKGCAQGMVDFFENVRLQHQIVNYLQSNDYGNEDEFKKIAQLLE